MLAELNFIHSSRDFAQDCRKGVISGLEDAGRQREVEGATEARNDAVRGSHGGLREFDIFWRLFTPGVETIEEAREVNPPVGDDDVAHRLRLTSPSAL